MKWEGDWDEFRHRGTVALAGATPLALLLGGGTYYAMGTPFYLSALGWTLAPFFVLSFLLIFRFCRSKGAFGSAPQAAPPKRLREGNPLVRTSDQRGSFLLGLVALSVAGCSGLNATSLAYESYYWALSGMYLSLGLIWWSYSAHTCWLELDAEQLRVWQHRMFYGLKLSREQEGKVRAVAVCVLGNNADGPLYAPFAFTEKHQAFPAGPGVSSLERAGFEAQRLADQLNVPMLEGMEQLQHEQVRGNLSRTSDAHLPFRKDWLPVSVPHDLVSARSVLPPLD